MNSQTTLDRFISYSNSLTKACVEHPKIIGLVLVGSTAETDRVDEWSDHDFFVLTEKGDQEELRQNLDWLPMANTIAFSFRETEHGLKVVYRSGAVLEFAIFDCDELSGCTVNHHRLAFGNEDAKQALATATNRLPATVMGEDLADFRHFLSLLVIQTGRARRGEILTAGQGIRGAGLTVLLKVLTRRLSPDSRLDTLDVTRRFEFVHSEIGRELGMAVALEPEKAGMELLNIAEKYLPTLWGEYPTEEVASVKEILGWV